MSHISLWSQVVPFPRKRVRNLGVLSKTKDTSNVGTSSGKKKIRTVTNEGHPVRIGITVL